MLTMHLPLSGGVADMPVIEGPLFLVEGDEVPVVAICGQIEDPDSGHSVTIRVPIMLADAPALVELLSRFCQDSAPGAGGAAGDAAA